MLCAAPRSFAIETHHWASACLQMNCDAVRVDCRCCTTCDISKITEGKCKPLYGSDCLLCSPYDLVFDSATDWPTVPDCVRIFPVDAVSIQKQHGRSVLKNTHRIAQRHVNIDFDNQDGFMLMPVDAKVYVALLARTMANSYTLRGNHAFEFWPEVVALE